MMRFRATLDGVYKIRTFSKFIESVASFAKESVVITLCPDSMIFFRSSDSIRVESMFELECHSEECFTDYTFMIGETTQERVSFDISIKHLVNAMSMMMYADFIKISMLQVDGLPVLRIKNFNGTAVQDIGIQFKNDAGPDDYIIPNSLQNSLSVTVLETSTLNNIFTAFKQMGNKNVTIVANQDSGELTFKGRAVTEVKSVVTLKEMGIYHKIGDDTVEHPCLTEEMTVTVVLNPLLQFCKIIPASTQSIEIQIINNISIRLFVHLPEGTFRVYVPCKLDIC